MALRFHFPFPSSQLVVLDGQFLFLFSWFHSPFPSLQLVVLDGQFLFSFSSDVLCTFYARYLLIWLSLCLWGAVGYPDPCKQVWLSNESATDRLFCKYCKKCPKPPPLMRRVGSREGGRHSLLAEMSKPILAPQKIPG